MKVSVNEPVRGEKQDRNANYLDPERPDKSSSFNSSILFQYHLGLWPSSERPRGRLGAYVRHYLPRVQAVRMVYSLYFQLVSMKMVWGDAYSMTEYAMNITFYTMTAVKIGTVYVHRHRIKNILEVLETYTRCGVFETSFATETAKSNKKWTIFILNYVIRGNAFAMAVALILMSPNALATRSIPFRLYFPYDVKPFPVFELTMLSLFFLSLLDYLYIVLCDVLFVVMVLHTASHFKILRYNLENLTELVKARLAQKKIREELEERKHKVIRPTSGVVITVNSHEQALLNRPGAAGDTSSFENEKVIGEFFDNTSDLLFGPIETDTHEYDDDEGKRDFDEEGNKQQRNADEFEREMKRCLTFCIKQHQSLIKITIEMKYIFKYMLAHQVAFNGFIGLLGLYISTLAESIDSKVMMIMTCLMGGVTEFVLYCWFSENLTEQSSRVAEAVYACDWLDMDPKMQRSLRLIMSRSQKACVITAAGIPLSRKTFRAVTKLAYYFHALLTRFYWGEKLLKTLN